MSEIELSQLAAQKASSSEVKQFAQRMVDDHQRANEQLRQIARDKGVTLPSSSESSDKDRFANLSGSEFDREYIRHQMNAHKDAISLFENQAANGKDPELKSFASNQLGNLRQHSSMANDLHSMSAARSSSSSSSFPSSMGRSEYGDDQNRTSGSTGQDNQSSAMPSGSSTTTTTTEESTRMHSDEDSRLPRTASNMPLIGLFGFMLLTAALIVRSFRLFRNSR